MQADKISNKNHHKNIFRDNETSSDKNKDNLNLSKDLKFD